MSGTNNAQMVKLVQQAMASAGVVGGVGGGVIAAPFIPGQAPPSSSSGNLPIPNSNKKTEGVKKVDAAPTGGTATATVLPQKTTPQAMGGKVAFPPQPMSFGQMVLTPSGLIVPQVFAMKVEEPVPVGKVSLESTSIELTGQVPIKKIDTETMEVVKESGDSSGKEANMADGGRGDEGSLVGSAGVGKEDSGKVGRGRDMVEGGGVGKEGEGGSKKNLGLEETSDSGEKAKNEVSKLGEDSAHKSRVPNTSTSQFFGHSTADIMSAELLLSLTGGGGAKAWPATSPKKGLSAKDSPAGVVRASTSGGGDTHTPSSGRKRKQKPIASAKPSQSGPQAGTENALKADISFSVPKPKRPRKSKKDEAAPVVSEESATKQVAGKEDGGTAKKSKQLTSEELLEILNIPPQAPPTLDTSKAATPTAPG